MTGPFVHFVPCFGEIALYPLQNPGQRGAPRRFYEEMEVVFQYGEVP
jgi:hypothetical protein